MRTKTVSSRATDPVRNRCDQIGRNRPCGQWYEEFIAFHDALRLSIHVHGVCKINASSWLIPVGSTSDLDADVAQSIARKIGVKVELVPTTPANRIPLQVSGKTYIAKR